MNGSVKIIQRILFNRDAVLSMIVPALIYGLTYRYLGLIDAVLASGFYAILVSFWLKSTKYIAFLFAVFGLIEVAIVWLIPGQWLLNTLFVKSLVGALQTALIFLIFALINKPIPKLFAEVASPSLKQWDFSQTKAYASIWQRLSYIWVLAYLAKALLLFALYPMNADSLVTFNLVSGWPMQIGLIVFSVPYVRRQFDKYASDKLVG
ncbi:hypothetical protein [Vibrio rhizosphaerae]|nr:hypothetical protein [Vibrio rhizosphaerae]